VSRTIATTDVRDLMRDVRRRAVSNQEYLLRLMDTRTAGAISLRPFLPLFVERPTQRRGKLEIPLAVTRAL
jgi:hypothetical protein